MKTHTKMHKKDFTSKALSKVENFKKLNLSCRHHKTGVKTQQKFAFFTKCSRVNVAQVSIIECVLLVNEGLLLLVIECVGCGS